MKYEEVRDLTMRRAGALKTGPGPLPLTTSGVLCVPGVGSVGCGLLTHAYSCSSPSLSAPPPLKLVTLETDVGHTQTPAVTLRSRESPRCRRRSVSMTEGGKGRQIPSGRTERAEPPGRDVGGRRSREGGCERMYLLFAGSVAGLLS